MGHFNRAFTNLVSNDEVENKEKFVTKDYFKNKDKAEVVPSSSIVEVEVGIGLR